MFLEVYDSVFCCILLICVLVVCFYKFKKYKKLVILKIFLVEKILKKIVIWVWRNIFNLFDCCLIFLVIFLFIIGKDGDDDDGCFWFCDCFWDKWRLVDIILGVCLWLINCGGVDGVGFIGEVVIFKLIIEDIFLVCFFELIFVFCLIKS